MGKVLLFDVNETLLDLSVLRPKFETVFGDGDVSQQWFAVLLHTSVVSIVTETYHDFGTMAGSALDVVAARLGLQISDDQRGFILGTIRELPPHSDVSPNLGRLRDAGFRLATLTNSAPAVVEAQITNAGLSSFFERQISVDEVRAFKPAQVPYLHAAKEMGVEAPDAWLIAAHDWDCFGALKAGCRAAFIARGGRPYHPLYEKPDVVGADLTEVTNQILEIEG